MILTDREIQASLAAGSIVIEQPAPGADAFSSTSVDLTLDPSIHAGFRGRIRLEMVNHGNLPIRLRPGMRICQLLFELTLGTPQSGYRGMFLDQGV